MKKTGIWIDKDKAYIITLKDGKESLRTITSNVEHYRPHGGSGTRLKGGPQDVVQDSKYLAREQQQLKRYYEDIVSHIKEVNTLVIFGPADTGEKLRELISQKHITKGVIIKAVKKADSMTENQMKAWVRDYYAIRK